MKTPRILITFELPESFDITPQDIAERCFSENEIELITSGLMSLQDDVQNDINTCPDPSDSDYAERLHELETLSQRISNLLESIANDD